MIRRVDVQPSAAFPNPAENVSMARKAEPTAQAHRGHAVKDGVLPSTDLRKAAVVGQVETRHVPLPTIAPGELHPLAPGRLDLQSAAAQSAVKNSLDFFAGKQLASLVAGDSVNPKNLVARSVDRDELGMTHVRLDRMQDGLKVYGQQVISHLDQSGKVAEVTGDTGPLNLAPGASEPATVTQQAAMETAKRAFLKENPGINPKDVSAEKVFYKAQDGMYHQAFRVEVTNLTDSPKPLRMNYMVDAHSAQVLSKFNTIDAVELPKAKPAAAADPVTVSGAATPGAAIKDLTTVTSQINIDQDLDVTKLNLNLDIDHSYRGDLVVTLTSPSGKSVDISNRQGGSADNIKGDFDLSAFKGEASKGTWTLSVSDKARQDEGKLNGWKLDITGTPRTGGGGGGGGGGGAAGTGSSLYSGSVPLSTHQNTDGTWSLQDDTRGGSKTLDAQNKSSASGNVGFKDGNNVWGEATDDKRTKAAIDAHYGMEMTWDFYKNVLGRNSIDDKGEALNSYVHLDNNYNNAYWDGKQMQYGDGDGTEFTPLTSIDIAGHEISHGLTERTAGLVYEGESGGLNEAFSDIMGKGVQWYAAQQNPAVKFSWGLGVEPFTPGKAGDALRYMDDPTKDGYSVDNYKNYPKQTEVHGSSGIANNAFVLAVQGGKNRTSGIQVDGGIGMEKALKIFYRAEAFYMTPNTTFAQAKAATVKAANDLYGADSQEAKTIAAAWNAVGVN